ncbi:hypothetical protein B0H19DRAFT_1164116 [Mycena capillaripes]|nr:hypothetical protein B0H19DRAFT_1164116 [Mycena capillaripes]
MSILHPLKYAVRLTRKLQARPGQLVYSREQTSITACFYELLRGRGLTLSSVEDTFLQSLQAEPLPKLGRPCVILDRRSDDSYTVCFVAQIRGKAFSPVGRFFGVPIDNTKSLPATEQKPSASFTPLRFTDPTGPDTREGRFYLFAVPVVRKRIHLPRGEPRYLVEGDLERTVELVRDRVTTCSNVHAVLRRDQLEWVEEDPLWRFKNPQEGGVGLTTYLRL